MPDHIANRRQVLTSLREELFGPTVPWDAADARVTPSGKEKDFSDNVRFDSLEDSFGPWLQASNGDEVLQRDSPTRRYGVGVLYPARTSLEMEPEAPADNAEASDDEPSATDADILSASAEGELQRIAERVRGEEPETEEFDLSGANSYRPSVMAISFLAEITDGSEVVIELVGGRYHRKAVQVTGRDRTWWLRSPVRVDARFSGTAFLGGTPHVVSPSVKTEENLADLPIEVTAFARPRPDGQTSLVTVSVVNRARHPDDAGPDEACLFQVRFSVAISVDGEPRSLILPYPEPDIRPDDEEEDSFRLLYRAMRTFGVGHGCAADWSGSDPERKTVVRAEPLPWVETPSITPRIVLPSGEELHVPMGPLAGLDQADDGMESMERIVSEYESWLRDVQEPRLDQIDERYQEAGRRHLDECFRALDRMRSGLALLRSNPLVKRAFQLANEAVLLQQLRTQPVPRQTIVDGPRFRVTDPLQVPDWRTASDRGSWRPFQIAFLLCALESVADEHHPDRDTVELIWFPTGGGKTEAYLGLSAFAVFYRRLQDPADVGVEVLMRYTLRLLTQQQFQRAAALVCAMEHLRRRETDLGDHEFSIGMWLGGSSTPNDRTEARRALRSLNDGDDRAENKFVLLRCPWCSAQMGPLETTRRRGGARTPRVAGYVEDGGTVVFRCPDKDCEFSTRLPVYVIDQDIYEARPAVIVATVDKFALLAWRPDCRALFGIGPDGTRVSSPPQTIIQDELHLISGPLGSMVGLYEAVIEDLCTDKRGESPVRPKIIGSTATIRRYADQVRGLYAREDVRLFPPRALDAGDSFFARFARESDGTLSPGRIYVGVHAPGLGSVQTAQVRTFSALLQAPQELDPEGRDPWWSLMVFFNSLRELGTSLSLLQSDIPNYLKVIRNRLGLAPNAVRRLRRVMELTGRLTGDQVPRVMEELSTRASSTGVVDVCLASNIIEVGIDIERLSVMVVVGQPKTTSQYIQVTGRVGRRWWERPGLIATVFSPTKPRDRSHFEQFRSYHERLYAQVEPTSVTPFSPPVLDRALHAVLCAYVRQYGAETILPWPVPVDLITAAYEVFARRVDVVDAEESGNLDAVFAERREEWERWQRRLWEGMSGEEIPLLRRAGDYASRVASQLSWSTPNSLRSVDAECRAEVTLRYVQEPDHV